MPLGKSCLNCRRHVDGDCSGIPLLDPGYSHCRRFKYI